MSEQSSPQTRGRGESPEPAPSRHATPDLDETVDRMDAYLDSFSSEGDPREGFLLMYRTFKNQLRKAIQQGRFLDASWSEAACVRMAETYFEAVQQYDDGDPACPEAWVRGFDRAFDGETNFLQDALLGMNAHINFDLVVATYDTLRKFDDLRSDAPASGVDRTLNRRLKRRYHDYLMINQIAWESIPLIQDVLTERYSALMGLLNRLSFRVSKLFMEKIIMDFRDRSWGHVLLMASVEGDEEMRRLRQFLDLQAVRNIDRVMQMLSWNPVEVARGAFEGFPPGEVELESEDYRAISRMLMEKLHDPATAVYARRALAQYGEESEPAVVDWLQKDETSQEMRKHLVQVLGELATPSAMSALVEQLPEAAPDVRNRACAELSEIARESTLPSEAAEDVRDDVTAELRRGVIYRQVLDDIPENVEVPLIRQTAEVRLARILLRSFGLLGVVLDRPDLAPNREDFLELQRPEDVDVGGVEVDELAEADERIWRALDELRTSGMPGPRIAAFLEWTEHYESWHARLKKWIRGDEEWLQQCAMLAAFRHRWTRHTESLYEVCRRNPDRWYDVTGSKTVPPKQGTVEEVISHWPKKNHPMLSTIERILHLKKVELFNEIPAEELTQVARLTKEEEHTPDDYLIRQGETETDLYILLEGTVEVVKDGTVITELEPESVMGEMSLLSDSPTSADCVSTSHVRVLTIPRKDFRELLYGDHPEIPLGLLKVLTRRLEETTRRAEQG